VKAKGEIINKLLKRTNRKKVSMLLSKWLKKLKDISKAEATNEKGYSSFLSEI
jgi:hypothetical protein